MSILLDERTPVIVQGFTGDKGTFHAKEMIAYGTHVVGGVTPGKGGATHLERPVFNTVKEAVAATGAVASLVLVPAPFCADAVMEAADAGIRLVVTITDGVPAQDMMRVKRYLWRYAKERRTRLIGPNCAGVISPGKAMMGIMPGHIYTRGAVGVVTRSGTLGYEAAAQMQALGVGITTSVGIGGDPINGSSFVDLLALFEEDPETDAVMMIGEIGGPQEADAARFVKEHMTKPVIGYVAGLTAPKGRRMGHAGAIISAFGDTAAEKAEIMRSAGLVVAPSPAELGSTVAQALARSGRYDALVCLGCVIRGETTHDRYVALGATTGLVQVSLEAALPVTFGVLTTQTLEQAEARSGGAHGNKGEDAALAAVELANLLRQIRAPERS